MADALLEEGLIKLGLQDEDGRILAALTRYMEEIELFNTAYGLVKVADRRELIVKHILDSLAPVNILRNLINAKAVADIGSGAGLPGIPLAICIGEAEFTLIERMARRAGFLRDAAAVLGLNNVRVEEADAEKLFLPVEARFDLIVFRAFKPIQAPMLKGLFTLLKPGGIIAAYKGRFKTIDEELNFLSEQEKPLSREIIPLEVPFLEEERHLVLIGFK
jgi:16S rRNA (guanine527-N7)-methyltransferase